MPATFGVLLIGHAAPAQAQAYDDFNTAKIDPDRWVGTQDQQAGEEGGLRLIRRIEFDGTEGHLVLSHRVVGGTSTNTGLRISRNRLRIVQNPNAITAVRFDVMVRDFSMQGCSASTSVSSVRAGFIGFLFNDGSGNAATQDATGDIIGIVGLSRSSDSTADAAVVRAVGILARCTEPACSGQRTTFTLVDLGPVTTGVTVTLRMNWDRANKKVDFQKNADAVQSITYPQQDDSRLPIFTLKALEARGQAPNCPTTLPLPFADITGVFDNVFLNAATNRPPVAADDNYKVDEDTLLTVGNPGVLSNDSDPDRDALTAILVSGPAHAASFTLNTNGSFTYTPTANFNGIDSFTYKANDGKADSNVATVTITVTPVNDPPVADDKTVSTNEDTAAAITLSASDIDSTSLTFSIVTPPSHGSLSLVSGTSCTTVPNGTGTPGSNCTASVTYTPAQDYNATMGLEGFTYKVNDGSADSNIATVSITVVAVNDAPVFNAIADQTVFEDAGPQSVSITGIAPGPPTATDEVGQIVTLTATSSNPAIIPHPTISVTGAMRTLTYQSNPNANTGANGPPVTITVTAQDNGGTTNGGIDTSTRTFTITVIPVNDPPVFDQIADQAVLEDAGSKSVLITGIVAGPPTATDELATQTVNVTATSSNAAIIPDPGISGSGATRTLSYQSNPDANGTVTITVTAKDDGGIANGGVDTFFRTFTITVTPVNDPPRFDTILAQTVLEDAGAQDVPINGITAGPAAPTDDEDFSQTVTLVATSSNPAIVPDPIILPSPVIAAGMHGPKTRTLRYQPAPDANGMVTITLTAKDNGGTANGGVDTFSRIFIINITPVNDPPFFAPIRDQLLDTAIDFPNHQAMVVTVGPGPVTARDEAGQTVMLTASVVNPSSAPNLISSLQVTPTSDPTVWTLSYDQAANAQGTATINLTATDNGGTANGGFDTSTTNFAVRVLSTLTEKRNTVAAVAPPDSASGFRAGDKIKATATFTAPALGPNQGCVFVLRPDPFINVIPRVNGQDATRLPEGGPVVVDQTRLLQICPGDTAEHRTVSIDITLNDWYPDLLGRTQGTQFYTLNYVNLVQDPDTSCTGTDCVTLLTGSADTTGVAPTGSQCPDLGDFGSGAGGTGCPFADKNTVTMQTVNLGGGTTTTTPLVGVQVKVFDRNSPDFQAFVAALTGATLPCPSCKNPDGSLYGLIFEGTAPQTQIDLNTTHALVGSCITSSGKDNPADAGVCFAGERAQGDFLAIVKFVDPTNGMTVYVGRPKSPSDFVNRVASKDFQIIKVLKNGNLVEYRGGSKTVIKGSVLEMIVPDSAVWEGTTSIYPFIFTSDSAWSVDVCAQVPAGYKIVGVYDEYGQLMATTQCVQTFVANQTKVVAFEVVDVGSPEPVLNATLTIKDPHGKTHVQKIRVPDIRRPTFDRQMRALKREQGPTQPGAPHGH